MLVQALTTFAEKKLQKQLDDVAFEERPVSYFLNIDFAGRFLGTIPRFGGVLSRVKTKPGKTAPVPKRRALDYAVPRSPVTLTSGTYALLGVGELKYVLGAGAWTEPQNIDRDNERLQAFVERLQHAYNDTHSNPLEACIRFYSNSIELDQARDAFRDASTGSYVAVQVDGVTLTDIPQVRAWWQHFYESECSGRAEMSGECLITGVFGPIPPTHPQIQHLTNIGGKARVALMSFNAPSFTSYGWEQNANSPVSADAALKYTMALNEMLRFGSPYRRDEIRRTPSGKSTGVAYLFWLRQDAEVNPGELVQGDGSADTISRVRRVLERDRRVWIENENIFHLVALSATGSRLIARSSIMELLPDAIKNVLGWWEGLQIKPLDPHQPMEAPFFWQLKFALNRKGEPSDDRVAMLWNRALAGLRRPLGGRIIGDILGRMRVDENKRMDLAALGLLRLSLNDTYETKGKGRPMASQLDETAPSRHHPAFVCGQLLALHDSLQYRTFDLAGEAHPNSTVADRFYTLVMNSPAIGMAKVFDLGRKHLTKLRRLPKQMPRMPQGGAPIAFAYEQLIARTQEPLGDDVPHQFDLHDKAHFALGFYHQKAYRPKKSSTLERVGEGIAAISATESALDIGEKTAPVETGFFKEMEQ